MGYNEPHQSLIMIEALRFHSWRGDCTDKVRAPDIRSRSSALELGPFVDPDLRPVYWVRWGTRESGKKIRPYFKHWSKEGTGRKMFPAFKEAVASREKSKGESPRHRKAKRVCVEALSELVKNGTQLPWAFKNPEISDFPMTGDFLSGVSEVREEYSIDTPFGEKYRFDVALIASGGSFKKPVRHQRLTL